MTPKRNTRNRILDAALERMYERGYDGTTTKSIAHCAGVNEVTLFRQFGSKRNLLMAVIERETDISEEMTDAHFPFTGDLESDLRMIGERMAHEMVGRARLLKIIMMEASSDPDIWEQVSKTPMQVIELITGYLESSKADGKLRDVDPHLAAVAFFSFFFRTTIFNAFLGSDVFIQIDDANIGGFCDMFVKGIGAEVG